VNILSPKQKRAILITVSSGAKLLSTFPCVLVVKTMYAEIASVKHEMTENAVEMCVTVEKRSNVGVRRLP